MSTRRPTCARQFGGDLAVESRCPRPAGRAGPAKRTRGGRQAGAGGRGAPAPRGPAGPGTAPSRARPGGTPPNGVGAPPAGHARRRGRTHRPAEAPPCSGRRAVEAPAARRSRTSRPLSEALRTPMRPPISSTSRREMLRPRPVRRRRRLGGAVGLHEGLEEPAPHAAPRSGRCRVAHLPKRKAREGVGGREAGVVAARMDSCHRAPGGVNLTALMTKIAISTWPSRRTSPQHARAARRARPRRSRPAPFSAAYVSETDHDVAISSRARTLPGWSCSLPASTFENRGCR
jgi:hypothetical protein